MEKRRGKEWGRRSKESFSGSSPSVSMRSSPLVRVLFCDQHHHCHPYPHSHDDDDHSHDHWVSRSLSLQEGESKSVRRVASNTRHEDRTSIWRRSIIITINSKNPIKVLLVLVYHLLSIFPLFAITSRILSLSLRSSVRYYFLLHSLPPKRNFSVQSFCALFSLPSVSLPFTVSNYTPQVVFSS